MSIQPSLPSRWSYLTTDCLFLFDLPALLPPCLILFYSPLLLVLLLRFPYHVACIGINQTPISAITLTLERPLIWLCLLVVVLSVVYVVIIGRKYTDYVQTTQPYIEEATERNEKLADAIKAEKEITRDVVSKVKEEELLIGDLKIGLAKLETEITEEKALEEKLELAQQVKQFNKKKP